MEIYLDNSATTKPLEAAVAAAVSAMRVDYGNPSSLHKMGFIAEQLMEKAKSQLAAALSCNKGEIYFTSGATEANNLAVMGQAMAAIRKGNRIVATAIEHPSVLQPLKQLEKQGFEIILLPPNKDGGYSPLDFYNVVDKNTILVCCMQVNNETGLIMPVEEIAKAVKRKNPETVVLVDAVQSFLKLPIKLKNSCIDLMSISGHKVHAPKGIGALYIRKGIRILPLMHGGGQQSEIRPGTEPIPLIAAFGAAAEAQSPKKQAKNSQHYKMLKQHFIDCIKEIPEIKENFEFTDTDTSEANADYIVSISVKGIRSEVMLHFLEQFDIYISSGSACAKGKQSHVLSALSIPKQTADETLRISFSPETTPQMLTTLADMLKKGIDSLAKTR